MTSADSCSKESVEEKQAPLRGEGLEFWFEQPECLEVDFHPQLQNAHWFSQSIDVRRAGQGRGGAAGPREIVVAFAGRGDRRRSYGRIARVLKVRMVENIECFHAQLQVKAFCQLDVLRHSGIQIPEAGSLDEVTAASDLARRRNAEEGLRADDIPAIVMRVPGGSNQIAGVVH